MPVVIAWEDSVDKLVRVDISGKWGWDDLRAANEQAIRESEGQPYDCIMNYVVGMTLPADLLGIGRQATTLVPPTLRRLVTVTNDNAVLSMIWKIYITLYGSRRSHIQFFTASRLEAAQEIMRSARAKSATA